MTDYARELRRLVGTRPLLLPRTSAVLVDEAWRLLLLDRADGSGWCLPGGLMEPGESFEETARREVREEVGVELGELTLLDVFSGAEYYYRFPHGDEIYTVTAAYLARVRSDAVLDVDPREAREARFFDIDDVPEDVLATERPIIARYAAHLKSSRPAGE
ncbi:NUDIX domain-containing protein [Actinomadura logoneensis]|uniref:NUDIX domain-containing protein n=1 Tax=Actinomadura logoneensis TaxID=2293572 RepID=A0A372JLI7_9ACTN|nr:NUDIX domain-containing protein [Actinomadura logoneensis]RFU40855.1 NUDIX domain-containing protein [Actinomadura logoneensis]